MSDISVLSNERLIQIKHVLSGFEDGYDTVDDKDNYEAVHGARLLVDEFISLRHQLEEERQRADEINKRLKIAGGRNLKISAENARLHAEIEAMKAQSLSRLAGLCKAGEKREALEARLANPVPLWNVKSHGDLHGVGSLVSFDEVVQQIHTAGFTTAVKGGDG